MDHIAPHRESIALEQAGFVDIQQQRLTHTFTFDSVAEHRLMSKVVLRTQIVLLPTEALCERFLDIVLACTDAAIGPQKQCYEPLRCLARRP